MRLLPNVIKQILHTDLQITTKDILYFEIGINRTLANLTCLLILLKNQHLTKQYPQVLPDILLSSHLTICTRQLRFAT